MAPITYTRLLPEAGEVEAGELLDTLQLHELAHPDRPYLVANFVSTADGRATFDGRSGPLGDEGDRAMFHGLRERVDAIMAGTITLATERYGRLLTRAERRERRAAGGHTPEPVACIISRSGTIPTAIPLFEESEARIVVFCPTKPDLSRVSAQVEVVLTDADDPNPLTHVMQTLRTGFGVRSLLCEGGPTIFGALLHEQLVDELFLTLAPKLTGGSSGPTIASGPPLADLDQLEVRWLLARESSLYLRYAVI
jgi:riboflavin-specific deaminase-like protein